MAIGLFLVMVIGITVIIGEVTKIEQEEAIAQYLTEMEKLTKDISEQSLTDSFMTYSSVNKELMEQLKECRQARDDGDIAKAKSIIGGSALEKYRRGSRHAMIFRKS